MPNPVDLSTILAQTPHVAKVKTAAVAQGEASKAELAKEAQEKLRRERAKVEKAEKGEAIGKRVDEDGGGGGQGGQGTPQDGQPEERDGENPSTCNSGHGSVCGQIINRRI